MSLRDALLSAVGDTVGMAHVFAVRLMVERLADAGILSTEDVISILNFGRGWGPTRKDYEWEVVPTGDLGLTEVERQANALAESGYIEEAMQLLAQDGKDEDLLV